jgi:poly-gamma-glutamate capsule biosynthesis protein CapA/YwtB (metallophosphatase superfamily)
MAPEVSVGGEAAAGDLLFAGDLVFGRDGLEAVLGPDLSRLIAGSRVAAMNLEGPLVAAPSERPKVGPHFAMPPEIAGRLAALGFDVAGLANNHVGDQGATGVLDTLAACREARLSTAGAGTGLADAARPVTRTVPDGTRVAILAFCESEFGVVSGDRPGVAPISAPVAVDAVRAARADHDVVVVLAHGGIEELPLPSPQRREQLRGLVDAGADLVVGHHPHVPQGWERHGDGVVFHSLGDLYVEGGYEPSPASLWGFVLVAGIRDRALAHIAVVPYERRADRLALAGERASARLTELSTVLADRDYEALWQTLAVRTFGERYLPFLARLGVPPPPEVRAPRGLKTVRLMLEPARAFLRRTPPPPEPPAPPAGWDALMLENLVRCESHRWLIETASGVLGGDIPDLRTPETERRAEQLLQAMAEGAAS